MKLRVINAGVEIEAVQLCCNLATSRSFAKVTTYNGWYLSLCAWGKGKYERKDLCLWSELGSVDDQD